MSRLPILLVEDEFLVRMALIDQLEEAGYEVLEAATAVDAWAALEARPDIALIFTDIHMPGDTDGLAFAKDVRERLPDIGILITSGKQPLQQADLPAGGLFLSKPYQYEDVERALATLLEKHAESVT